MEWKQKLQALGYNQIQTKKPTEVKNGSKINLSFKKLAIWCWIVLILIFIWFFITLYSLINNPTALQWIWLSAANAKTLLQAFTGLIFWSIILLMIWVIVANIYRLITVKNQWKRKFVIWLFWWIIWWWIVWALMWIVFWQIWKIVTEVKQIDYDIIQPYLVWRVEIEGYDEFKYPYDNGDMEGFWQNYALIAPSEMAFSFRRNELAKLTSKELPSWSEIVNITFSCGNKDNKILNQAIGENWNWEMDQNNLYKFEWTCLYTEKWKYTYSINITYDTISKERKMI